MIWSSFDNFRQKNSWFYYHRDFGNFWVNTNSSRQKQAKNWRTPAHWDGLGKQGVWKSGRRKESAATTTRDGLLCNISPQVGQLDPGPVKPRWDWQPHFQLQWDGWEKKTSGARWYGSIKRVHTKMSYLSNIRPCNVGREWFSLPIHISPKIVTIS